MFCIFANLLHVWLNRKQMDSPIGYCVQSAVIPHSRNCWKAPANAGEARGAAADSASRERGELCTQTSSLPFTDGNELTGRVCAARTHGAQQESLLPPAPFCPGGPGYIWDSRHLQSPWT